MQYNGQQKLYLLLKPLYFQLYHRTRSILPLRLQVYHANWTPIGMCERLCVAPHWGRWADGHEGTKSTKTSPRRGC